MTTELENVVDPMPYLITLPIYIILFIIEFIIFLHFAIKTHPLDISRTIRYFALLIGLIVLSTLCLELWSILVDLSWNLPSQSNGYCFLQIFVRFISFILLECTLFIFWVIRLRHTFNGSVLALSNIFVYIMFISIPLIAIILIIILIISIQPRYFQIALSFNPDINKGFGCTTINNLGISILFIGGQIIAIFFNIFFGIFFYHKLKQFIEIVCHSGADMSSSSDIRNNNNHYRSPSDIERTNVINILMQKHTLLALLTVFSGIIAYITFDILIFNIKSQQFAFLFIDIDMVIKTITCFLMFKFYEKRFYHICWCCIKIAAMPCHCNCCRRPININDQEEEKRKMINDKTSIFSDLAQKANDVRHENVSSNNNDGDRESSEYEDRWCVDSNIRKSSASISGIKASSDSNLDTNSFDESQNNKYNKKTLRLPSPKNKKIPMIVPLRSASMDTECDEYKLGQYTFYALLSKVKMEENNVKSRIFQYAMRNEKIEDDEGIFRKIGKQYKKNGYFMDNSDGTTKCNIFYYKNNECKFAFILAMKLNTESIRDGHIITKYASKRIQDTLDEINSIKGYQYEPLLEEILDEIRSKDIDITDIDITDNNNNNNKNKKRNITKKSQQKITRLPAMPSSHKSVPSYSGNYTPNTPNYTETDNMKNEESPFGKIISINTPQRTSTASTLSTVSNKNNKSSSNWTRIQTANQIQMSHLR